MTYGDMPSIGGWWEMPVYRMFRFYAEIPKNLARKKLEAIEIAWLTSSYLDEKGQESRDEAIRQLYETLGFKLPEKPKKEAKALPDSMTAKQSPVYGVHPLSGEFYG